MILDRQTFYKDAEDTYQGIKHGYIKNDFDVNEWAAPEFLEKAAKELLEEKWQKVTAAKLPEATSLWLG